MGSKFLRFMTGTAAVGGGTGLRTESYWWCDMEYETVVPWKSGFGSNNNCNREMSPFLFEFGEEAKQSTMQWKKRKGDIFSEVSYCDEIWKKTSLLFFYSMRRDRQNKTQSKKRKGNLFSGASCWDEIWKNHLRFSSTPQEGTGKKKLIPLEKSKEVAPAFSDSAQRCALKKRSRWDFFCKSGRNAKKRFLGHREIWKCNERWMSWNFKQYQVLSKACLARIKLLKL